VVALTVAIAQGTYAFAPAAFGLVRGFAATTPDMAGAAAPVVFIAAACTQTLAICAFLVGRKR
jgi:hypothetical protein